MADVSRSPRRSNMPAPCRASRGWRRCRRPPLRNVRLISCLALAALGAGGCAIDNHGFVVGRITHADGALVADLYSIGAHMKTRPSDAGVVVGYSRVSYVFARASEQSSIAEGWHAFTVPLPAAAPKALHLESVGASAHGNHSNFGMTLGYRAFTLLAHVPANADVLLTIRYSPSQPSRTRLRACKEVAKCADLY